MRRYVKHAHILIADYKLQASGCSLELAACRQRL